MDLPYLAILWNPLDPDQSQAAETAIGRVPQSAWTPVLQRAGIVVYGRNSPVPYLCAHVMCDGQGVLLGTLFNPSGQHSPLTSNLESDSTLAVAEHATIHRLTRHHWGCYVALISNPSTGNWWALRDCSGMIPCYYTHTRNVTLFASDARYFRAFSGSDSAAPLMSFDINWRYIAAFLSYSQLQIRDTAIAGIYELLAGEVLSCQDGRRTINLEWNPLEFIEPDPGATIPALCDSMRHVLQSSIDAWAGVHESLLHSLSGGFDSSLVLALLARSSRRRPVICVNRYAEGPAEDERRYARISANSTRTPLLEMPWEFGQQSIDKELLPQTLGAKPSITATVSLLEKPFFDMLRASYRFDAIWTGEGGDHVLLAMPTDLIVRDSIRLRGIGRPLIETLHSASQLTGNSIPRLIWRTLFPHFGTRDPFVGLCRGTNSFVSTQAIRHFNPVAYSRHPWAAIARSAPPGKRQQILLLAEAIHRRRPPPLTQGCMELQPILSQPIIEACLRIPTYDLLYRGHSRGLARHAFTDVVPAEILSREVKGQTTHHAIGLLDRSMNFLSEYLLCGELAHHDLLSRPTLESIVTRKVPLTGSHVLPLFACLAAEAWIGNWIGTSDHYPRDARDPT